MMNKRASMTGTADRIREYPARFLTTLWVLSSIGIAVLGPFGTFQLFSFPERLANWAFAIGMSIILGLVVNRAAQMLLGPGRNRFLYDLIAVPALMALYVPTLYLHVNHYPMATIELPLWFLTQNVLGVCLVLIALRELLGYYIDKVHRADAGVDDGAAPEANGAASVVPLSVPLLDRLPEPVRGAVLHIAADNHYIEVRTEHGAASILMRLSDAIRELGEQSGLQVHRSHWVGDRAVVSLHRDGARLSVVLVCGSRIPVSRSQSTAVMQRWGQVYAGATVQGPLNV